jgi:hypothetical protein
MTCKYLFKFSAFQLVKLPFGKRKKTAIASGQQGVPSLEERELKKKRKTLKTKEEMEKV